MISVQGEPTEQVRLADPTAEVCMAEPTAVDPTAEEMVRGYLVSALRLARMLVGNWSNAEDVAAESVARLLAARRRIDPENAQAYLRRIVVNQVIGRGRRSATERRLGHRFVSASSSGDAGDQIVGRATLAAALDQLPPRRRAVLVLRYYEDLSEHTVAELLRIPLGTVKSSASRGLDDLRRLLEEGRDDG
ncbi:MAG: SigE family polymerase sigma factor [Actinomycetia bacterium]|nr:SigE family polymerase sigma factor [Actinomycetes bacterium]